MQGASHIILVKLRKMSLLKVLLIHILEKMKQASRKSSLIKITQLVRQKQDVSNSVFLTSVLLTFHSGPDDSLLWRIALCVLECWASINQMLVARPSSAVTTKSVSRHCRRPLRSKNQPPLRNIYIYIYETQSRSVT